jgi:ferredoxin
MQAYAVLSNEQARDMYDIDLSESKMERQMGFQDVAISEWLPATAPSRARHTDPAEQRALFVDEGTCIGCKNCLWQAANTFIMDDEHGRARVLWQWADSEADLQAAVGATCALCLNAPYHENYTFSISAALCRTNACNVSMLAT